MKKLSVLFAGSILMLAIALAGCSTGNQEGAEGENEEAATAQQGGRTVRAVAQLEPTQGSTARGTVEFTQVEGGVQVVASVEGLTPGEHGFHVHEFGDCSAFDAQSAGGHFAPEGNQHGGPADSERHAGDLGNITVGADSTGQLIWVDQTMELEGPNSIIGKAVVVHADPDDLASQPAGNSGARLACGVIEEVEQ